MNPSFKLLTWAAKMNYAESDLQDLMKYVNEAAQKAAQIWYDVARSKGPAFVVGDANLFTGEIERVTGTMLDLCGNAFLKFRDKRSALYKACKKHGFESFGALDISYKLQGRQEHGLHVAAMKAALEVLNQHGLGDQFILRDYID
jgi:hypothetical protein